MSLTHGRGLPGIRRISARAAWDRSVHRVLYTLLFMFVAVAMATLVVPPLRMYSGVHEQIIALAVVMLLAVELVSTRLHRFVDWLLYGQRNDPVAATARLARPITDSDDEHTLEELLAAMAETLRLSYVGVALHEPTRITEVGLDTGTATLALPIRRAGRELGILRAGRRGQPLDGRDERLLEAAAAQIGLVLHTRSLADEVREAREELVSVVEEERRRQRRHGRKQLLDLRGAQDARIVHTVLERETLHLVDRPGVLRDADHLQVVLVAGLECDEVRDLFTARRAPGGPEVHEDDLPAAVGRSGDRTAVEIDAGQRRDLDAVLEQLDARARGRGGPQPGLDPLGVADHREDRHESDQHREHDSYQPARCHHRDYDRDERSAIRSRVAIKITE